MTVQEQKKPLNVTVIGHTNTGKTSLIRTMLRSAEFGVIEDAAGTTRHVEQTTVSADDEVILNLHDTPGLEDSIALYLYLNKISKNSPSLSAIAVMENFIEHTSIEDPLEQEAKVIRQVLRSDIILYLIDVREPTLEKYQYELEILSKALKPIIPVFNFIAGHQQELVIWREKLASFNIYTALEFDTVVFTFEAEKRLYQKMQTLVEPYYSKLQKLINYRSKIWDQLCLSGAKRVTELIVTVACYRESKKIEEEENIINTLAADKLQTFIRNAEQSCLKDLLSIFNFSEKDVEIQKIPISNGQWKLDIFAPGILKSYGLDLGASTLKGATAGAGIDIMTAGLSLGLFSALGAIAGASWSTAKRYGKEIKASVQGTEWLCANENTLRILYLRQQQLLEKLIHRGHAAQQAVKIKDAAPEKLPYNWLEITSTLRQNPAWQKSSTARNNNKDYQKIEAKLVSQLLGKN